MGIEDTGKEKPSKKRLGLDTAKTARASLCKLMRLRFNNAIDTATFRDLVYAFNVLLNHDKHILESEMSKRIEQLEQLIRGEGGTILEQKDIDNPYAQNLKKQLASESQVNAQLNNEILSLKRRLAENRAASTDTESVGVA
jgi:hypothetical protein